jgi:hypothetical protein
VDWLEGIRKFVRLSRATMTPSASLPSLPVNGVEAGGEDVPALQEKGALFGIEESELGVDVELRDVRFYLGEVRIDRRAEHQIGRDAPAGGDPGLDVGAAVLELPVGEVDAGATHRRGECRVELDRSGRLHTLEPDDFRGLAEIAVVAAFERVEPDPVALVPGVNADHVDSPGHSVGGAGKTQRGEGQPHLDFVPGLGEAAGGVPDGVPGIVLVAGHLVHGQVHLHPEGVGEELEGPPLVVERVEDQAHEVVLVGGVAIREPGADPVRLGIVGAEGDVKTVHVVGDPDLGADGSGTVLGGSRFVGQLERRGLSPGALVEPSVDLDLLGDLAHGVGRARSGGRFRSCRDVLGECRTRQRDADHEVQQGA